MAKKSKSTVQKTKDAARGKKSRDEKKARDKDALKKMKERDTAFGPDGKKMDAG